MVAMFSFETRSTRPELQGFRLWTPSRSPTHRYTLGGFFLASYNDSPAGVFDELVVIAGIVWNPLTSCAWAARVLVNSDEACHHGRKEVTSETEKKLGNWMGPAIKMSLPSFSGNTKYYPKLLKYSCHLHCRVRPVRPAVVSNPLEDEDLSERNHTSQEQLENEKRLSVAVMLSKPIIALQFKDLTMQVEAPVVVYPSV